MEATNIKLQFNGHDLSLDLSEEGINFTVEKEGEIVDELMVELEDFDGEDMDDFDGEEIQDFDEFGEGGQEDDFDDFDEEGFDSDDDFEDEGEDDDMALESFTAFTNKSKRRVRKKSSTMRSKRRRR